MIGCLVMLGSGSVFAQGFSARDLQRAQRNGQGTNLYGSNPYEQVDGEGEARAFHDLAERINSDRRSWLGKAEFDLERKNEMQMRNLGDTAAAALKAALRGGDVKEAVRQGIETANDIEEGKVKRGFFGKLIKK